MKPITARSTCPLSFTLDFLGDKWTFLILRDMFLYNKKSYNEFLQSNEKIATNILASRLSLLESNHFITSSVSPDNKIKFIYSLTEKAIDLFPILAEMYVWGSKYSPSTNIEQPIQKEIRKNKTLAIKKHTETLLKQLEQSEPS